MEKKIKNEPTNKEKIEKLILLIFKETRKWLKKGNDAFEFKFKYEISELAFKEAYNEIFKNIILLGIDADEFKVDHIELTIKFINGIFTESMKLITANPDLKIENDVCKSIFKLIIEK